MGRRRGTKRVHYDNYQDKARRSGGYASTYEALDSPAYEEVVPERRKKQKRYRLRVASEAQIEACRYAIFGDERYWTPAHDEEYDATHQQ